jgi:hypothetical protein
MTNHGDPPMPATGSDETSPPVLAYLTCLALQSAAALAIIAAIQRAFRAVIDDLGVRHPVSLAEFTMLVGTMCCSQAVYWYRVARIDIPAWRGVALGHLVGFASQGWRSQAAIEEEWRSIKAASRPDRFGNSTKNFAKSSATGIVAAGFLPVVFP